MFTLLITLTDDQEKYQQCEKNDLPSYTALLWVWLLPLSRLKIFCYSAPLRRCLLCVNKISFPHQFQFNRNYKMSCLEKEHFGKTLSKKKHIFLNYVFFQILPGPRMAASGCSSGVTRSRSSASEVQETPESPGYDSTTRETRSVRQGHRKGIKTGIYKSSAEYLRPLLDLCTAWLYKPLTSRMLVKCTEICF